MSIAVRWTGGNRAMCRHLIPPALIAILTIRAQAELPVPGLAEPPTNQPASGIVVPQPISEKLDTNRPFGVFSQPSVWIKRFTPAPVREQDQLLLLGRGEHLGQLVAWDGPQIVWKHAGEQGGTMTQAVAKVAGVRMGTPANQPLPQLCRWIVELTDGSLLLANTVRFGPEEIELSGGATGPLRLPRTMVRLINQALSDETAHPLQIVSRWPTADGRQLAVKDVGLPDEVSITFRLPPNPKRRISLGIYWSEKIPGNGIWVKMHGREMTVYRPGSPNQFQLPASADATATEIQLFVYRVLGQVEVYVNGTRLGIATMRGFLDSAGRGLVLQTEMWRTPDLPAWFLIRPLVPAAKMVTPKPDEELISFANGDSVAGRIESWSTNETEELVFNSDRGRLAVPFSRLRAVQLASVGRRLVAPRVDDLMLELRDGSQLLARLRELGPNELTVEGQLLGALRLPRSAVAFIRESVPTVNASE